MQIIYSKLVDTKYTMNVICMFVCHSTTNSAKPSKVRTFAQHTQTHKLNHSIFRIYLSVAYLPFLRFDSIEQRRPHMPKQINSSHICSVRKSSSEIWWRMNAMCTNSFWYSARSFERCLHRDNSFGAPHIMCVLPRGRNEHQLKPHSVTLSNIRKSQYLGVCLFGVR